MAPEIVRIYGEEGMSVRAGDENGLTLQMYKEFSNAPGTAVAFTAEELSASEYEIEQGGEYVTVESGVVKVKAGYDASGMREVKIRVKLNGITSEVIVVKIIIPVKTVTISAEKTQIEVGDTLKLSATGLRPATRRLPLWIGISRKVKARFLPTERLPLPRPA